MSIKYWAIIPAAGIGARMNADRPKQYLTIHGKTLLERVVNCFTSVTQIEKVVVVLHAKDHFWQHLTLSHPDKVLTVIGGKERVHSVLLGLNFLQDYADQQDFVLVHDAARPCVTGKIITDLMTSVQDHPVGGIVGLPVVDTIKRVDEDHDIVETVSREGLWYAQTPQCFRYELLKNAIENALSDNKIVTDESSALELLGCRPKMIPGDAQNIKITFPEDLAYAAHFSVQ